MDFMNPIQSEGWKPGASCGCGMGTGGSSCRRESWCLQDYPLAMVYSPCQTFGGLYDGHMALKQGTLFKELDLPFEGAGHDGKGRGCCR